MRGPGYTSFNIRGKTYILSRQAASDLLRYNKRVSLEPSGTLSPKKGGTHEISIPEIGEFWIFADQLRKTIEPKGGINLAKIYEIHPINDLVN